MCLVSKRMLFRRGWSPEMIAAFLPAARIVQHRTLESVSLHWTGDEFEVVEHYDLGRPFAAFELDDVMAAEVTEAFAEMARGTTRGRRLLRVLELASEPEMIKPPLGKAWRRGQGAACFPVASRYHWRRAADQPAG